MVVIDSISVDNLRGYNRTTLSFNKLTILVGENNEGKSSLLKMLERAMQIPSEFWNGERILNEEDYEFWYPANNAMHKARRLTIAVQFLDGRVARRFNVTKNDIVDLRLAIGSLGNCRLNIGAPKKNETHDRMAQRLFDLLKQEVELVVLPPVRDSTSSEFTQKATREVKNQLEKKMAHSRQGGAPIEYRLAKEAISKIQKIVEAHKGELSRSNDSPLASMLKSSEVRVELFPRDIYSLIEKSMFVYLSTGDHDALKVLPGEVGNGLQSLIDINLTIEALLKSTTHKSVIVIVEEPEAFLHPSAQRQFMQFLRRALIQKVHAAILTTHSPIILDEAKYEEIVLVRNQKHFSPIKVVENRASINTSLMTTASSELFFARTVVLIEGEGDKAFFNTLLRRIKNKATVCADLSGLVFQATGGCTFYAPWLKLVKSYKRGTEHPFDCLWIMDGDAAVMNGERPVLRLEKECGFHLEPQQVQTIIDFGDEQWAANVRTVASVTSANEVLATHDGYLFSCDFEWALFNQASNAAIKSIKTALSIAQISTDGSHIELARRLGSKVETGKASDGAKKQPFIRALIAEHLDFASLPPEIYNVLRRIFMVSYKNKKRVDDIFQVCGISRG